MVVPLAGRFRDDVGEACARAAAAAVLLRISGGLLLVLVAAGADLLRCGLALAAAFC